MPIVGHDVLGNAVSEIALYQSSITARPRGCTPHHDVETLLSMGASPLGSGLDLVREALRSAMTPTINSLMVVGIVTIPGMMTGQILGGASRLKRPRPDCGYAGDACLGQMGSIIIVAL